MDNINVKVYRIYTYCIFMPIDLMPKKLTESKVLHVLVKKYCFILMPTSIIIYSKIL